LPVHVCRRQRWQERNKSSLPRHLREGVQDPEFIQLMHRVGGSLGSHSRKFPATWVIQVGGTQDEVDIRGRWKNKTQAVSPAGTSTPTNPTLMRSSPVSCVSMGQLCWRATLGVLFSVNMSCLLLSPFYGDGLLCLTLLHCLSCGPPEPSMAAGTTRHRQDSNKEYEAVRGNGWSSCWSILSRRCHVNLQKQSTLWLITRREWSNPSRRHGVAAAPLQAARRQQQSNAVVSQLHTMNLRLTRIEEAVALLLTTSKLCWQSILYHP
jgi:hypothetical protein